MERVKCRVCSNTDGKKCLLKKIKVGQNKSRVCGLFNYDPSKIKIKKKLEATYVPYYQRSRKEYKRYVEKEMKKQAIQKAEVTQDCLANFRSSATQDDA